MSLHILPYIGSKRLDLPFFKDFIPNDMNEIIEPFGGSGYLSLYLFSMNNNLKCIINDTDKELINFFKNIKEHKNELIEKYNNLLDFKNKEEYNKIIDNYKKIEIPSTLDDAVLYLFYNKVYNMRRGLYPTSKKINKISIDKYKTFFDWLKNTTFTNFDYKEVFEKYIKIKKTNSFIFLDPPYFDSHNREYSSHKESADDNNNVLDNTKVFIDIVDYLKNNKIKKMLIINKNAITEYIYKKYIKGEYEKLYQMTKKKTKHLIICNY